MKQFSDFATEEPALEGDKIRLDDIINRRIVVIGYRIRNSRFSKNKSGKYLALQFDLDGKRMVCFTGSDVLIEQLEKYGSEAPFEATIKKINRYYTLA